MSAILLLPGHGGKYTSESFTSSSTAGADTIDASRLAQFNLQIIKVSGTPSGTVQLQNSLDGTNWANYGNPIDVATNGAVTRADLTAGPFGLLRITPSVAAGTIYVLIVGFETQVGN